MKSQGLPLNFIVLAALAILILILAAAFVIMGGKSIQRTMSPQAARSNCKNICYDMQSYASKQNYNSSSMNIINATFGGRWCAKQDIQGIGKNLTCVDIGETCYVKFKNDVQKKITCQTEEVQNNCKCDQTNVNYRLWRCSDSCDSKVANHWCYDDADCTTCTCAKYSALYRTGRCNGLCSSKTANDACRSDYACNHCACNMVTHECNALCGNKSGNSCTAHTDCQ